MKSELIRFNLTMCSVLWVHWQLVKKRGKFKRDPMCYSGNGRPWAQWLLLLWELHPNPRSVGYGGPISIYPTRGDHPTKNVLKVSPVAVFIKRNYLALVPGHLNQWFWRDFVSKFGGVLGCFRGLEGPKCKNKATFVPWTEKVFYNKSGHIFPFWSL